MKKFNFLVSMMFFVFVSESFGMNDESSLISMASKEKAMFSVHVVNKNFRQLPNDGNTNAVHLLVVRHADKIRDIVPFPGINKNYTFPINPEYIGGNLSIQLGQFDSSSPYIHSDTWCKDVMVVSKDPTYFSNIFSVINNFTITIEDHTSYLTKPEGTVQLLVSRNSEETVLRQIFCCVLRVIGAESERSLKKLVLLSDILQKYPSPTPIQIETNKELKIDTIFVTEERKMMEKHGTYQAWLN